MNANELRHIWIKIGKHIQKFKLNKNNKIKNGLRALLRMQNKCWISKVSNLLKII